MFDYDANKFWLDAIQSVALVLIAIYKFFVGKDEDNSTAIKDVDVRVDEIEKEMISMKSHLLDEQTVSELYNRLNSLNREIGELQKELQASTRILNIVHTHLMNRNT